MLLAAFYHGILAFFFAVIALLLIVVVLLQRGKGVGLAGAFGGTGGAATFGAKTGDMLTWATVVIAGVFLVVAILLNYVFVPTPPDLPDVAPPGGGGAQPIAPGGTAPPPPPPPAGGPTGWHDGLPESGAFAAADMIFGWESTDRC